MTPPPMRKLMAVFALVPGELHGVVVGGDAGNESQDADEQEDSTNRAGSVARKVPVVRVVVVMGRGR